MDNPQDVMPPTKGQGDQLDTKRKTGLHEETWKHVKAKQILFVGRSYIVYIDSNDDLLWETSPEFDEATSPDVTKFDAVKFNRVISESEILSAQISGHLPKPVAYLARSLVGAALSNNFELDFENATKSLDAARSFIENRNLELSRYWYLIASARVAVPIFLLGVLFLVLGERYFNWSDAKWYWAIGAFAAGATGALLSIVLRASRVQMHPMAGFNLHALDAALRIFVGAISGVVVFGAIDAGLVLSALKSVNEKTAGLLAALAGGAGERLVGSIIALFDGETPPATVKSATSDDGAAGAKK